MPRPEDSTPLAPRGFGAPKFLEKSQDKFLANEDENAYVQLEVFGDPAPTVKWLRGEVDVCSLQRFRGWTDGERGLVFLGVENAQRDDEGIYRCAIENRFGKREHKFKLFIARSWQEKRGPPKKEVPLIWSEVPRSKFIKEGSAPRVSFTAKLTASDKEVKWFFKGQEVFDGDKYELIRQGGNFTIVITDPCPEDTGCYRCVVKDVDMSCETYLDVQPPDPEYSFLKTLPSEAFGYVGRALKLSCIASHGAQVMWTKNGMILDKKNFKFDFELSSDEGEHVLLLPNLTSECAGQLSCAITKFGKEGEDVTHTFLNVEEIQHKFAKKLPHNICLMEREDLKIQVVTEEEDAVVKWFRDNVELVAERRRHQRLFFHREGALHTLRLENVKPSETGSYTARTNADSSSCDVQITEYEYKFADSLPEEVRVLENAKLVLEVHVEDSQAEVNWYLNDTKIQPERSRLARVQIHSEGCKRSLVIRKSTMEDIGVITAKTNTHATHTNVRVNCHNSFIQRLPDVVDCSENTKMEFEVTVKDIFAPVHFYKDRIPVDMDDERIEYVNLNNGHHKLIIHKIMMDDAGLISCKTPSNKDNMNLECKCIFNVTEGEGPPVLGTAEPVMCVAILPQYSDRMNSYIHKEQCRLVVPYRIDGSRISTVDISIEKDGRELDIGNEIQMRVKKDQIIIDVTNPKRSDTGKYKVCMSNAQGYSETTVEVTVLDTPTPPPVCAVKEVYKNSVTVGWEPSADEGGTPIKHYIVEMLDMTTNNIWSTVALSETGDDTDMVISGLMEGHRLSFRVAAVNKIGQSIPTELVGKDIITKDPWNVPWACGRTEVLDWTPTFADICWSGPDQDGGTPVIKYILQLREKSMLEWVDATDVLVEDVEVTPDQKFRGRVENLEEENQYRFRVLAVNRAGRGEPGPASQPVIAMHNNIPPSIKGDGLKDMKVKEGKSVRFDLWIAGEPSPTIEWFRNDIKIVNDEYTSISCYTKNSSVYTLKNLVLSIPKTIEDIHSGCYKLRLKNESGVFEAAATLEVEGKPGEKKKEEEKKEAKTEEPIASEEKPSEAVLANRKLSEVKDEDKDSGLKIGEDSNVDTEEDEWTEYSEEDLYEGGADELKPDQMEAETNHHNGGQSTNVEATGRESSEYEDTSDFVDESAQGSDVAEKDFDETANQSITPSAAALGEEKNATPGGHICKSDGEEENPPGFASADGQESTTLRSYTKIDEIPGRHGQEAIVDMEGVAFQLGQGGEDHPAAPPGNAGGGYHSAAADGRPYADNNNRLSEHASHSFGVDEGAEVQLPPCSPQEEARGEGAYFPKGDAPAASNAAQQQDAYSEQISHDLDRQSAMELTTDASGDSSYDPEKVVNNVGAAYGDANISQTVPANNCYQSHYLATHQAADDIDEANDDVDAYANKPNNIELSNGYHDDGNFNDVAKASDDSKMIKNSNGITEGETANLSAETGDSHLSLTEVLAKKSRMATEKFHQEVAMREKQLHEEKRLLEEEKARQEMLQKQREIEEKEAKIRRRDEYVTEMNNELDNRLAKMGFERSSSAPTFQPDNGDGVLMSLLDQMNKYPQDFKVWERDDYSFLRWYITRIMETHIIQKNPFKFIEDISTDLDHLSYIELISNEGVHLDRAFLQAAATIFNKDIILVPPKADSAMEVLNGGPDNTKGKGDPFYFGFISGTDDAHCQFYSIFPGKNAPTDINLQVNLDTPATSSDSSSDDKSSTAVQQPADNNEAKCYLRPQKKVSRTWKRMDSYVGGTSKDLDELIENIQNEENLEELQMKLDQCDDDDDDVDEEFMEHDQASIKSEPDSTLNQTDTNDDDDRVSVNDILASDDRATSSSTEQDEEIEDLDEPLQDNEVREDHVPDEMISCQNDNLDSYELNENSQTPAVDVNVQKSSNEVKMDDIIDDIPKQEEAENNLSEELKMNGYDLDDSHEKNEDFREESFVENGQENCDTTEPVSEACDNGKVSSESEENKIDAVPQTLNGENFHSSIPIAAEPEEKVVQPQMKSGPHIRKRIRITAKATSLETEGSQLPDELLSNEVTSEEKNQVLYDVVSTPNKIENINSTSMLIINENSADSQPDANVLVAGNPEVDDVEAVHDNREIIASDESKSAETVQNASSMGEYNGIANSECSDDMNKDNSKLFSTDHESLHYDQDNSSQSTESNLKADLVQSQPQQLNADHDKPDVHQPSIDSSCQNSVCQEGTESKLHTNTESCKDLSQLLNGNELQKVFVPDGKRDKEMQTPFGSTANENGNFLQVEDCQGNSVAVKMRPILKYKRRGSRASYRWSGSEMYQVDGPPACTDSQEQDNADSSNNKDDSSVGFSMIVSKELSRLKAEADKYKLEIQDQDADDHAAKVNDPNSCVKALLDQMVQPGQDFNNVWAKDDDKFLRWYVCKQLEIQKGLGNDDLYVEPPKDAQSVVEAYDLNAKSMTELIEKVQAEDTPLDKSFLFAFAKIFHKDVIILRPEDSCPKYIKGGKKPGSFGKGRPLILGSLNLKNSPKTHSKSYFVSLIPSKAEDIDNLVKQLKSSAA